MVVRAKSLFVVDGRIHYLLASMLLAMIGKSLDTSHFTVASSIVLACAVFMFGLRRVTRFQPQRGCYDIGYRVFGLPLWIKRFDLNDDTAVKVEHKVINNNSKIAEHRYIVSLVGMPAQRVATLRNDSRESRLLGEK